LIKTEQVNNNPINYNTGNIDIKDLKVILRALGFEPQEDEIKKLLSKINRSDEEENNKKGFSSNTIDFDEFLRIMSSKLVKFYNNSKIIIQSKLFL
jgi:centrin-1